MQNPGIVSSQSIQVGKTVYLLTVEIVEGIPGHPNFESVSMTGPRGAVLMVVPYVDRQDVYHAFRASGSHADLKDPATGRPARFRRTGNTFELI